MSFSKFNSYNPKKYWEDYFNRDKEFYNAIKTHIREAINSKDTIGIDIGAGPGIGAKLLSDLNFETSLTGFEPSQSLRNFKGTLEELKKQKSLVIYTSKQQGISEIPTPEKDSLDYILILRAAHEISESLGSKSNFFENLNRIIKGLKITGKVILADPQYFEEDIKKEIIEKVQEYQKEKIGHCHIPSDYISANQMKRELSGLGLTLIKETILRDKKLLDCLVLKGITLNKSPWGFYIQTFEKK